MSDKLPITLDGKIKLEAEVRRLKNEERPQVIQQIAIARAHGDLKENAEYHAAREKQSFIEGRILELEDKLARADVIDLKNIQSDKIMFGARVTLSDEDGKTKVYQIFGEAEADVSKGLISITSPIARALVGKKVGDEVAVNSPKGAISYVVDKIEYK